MAETCAINFPTLVSYSLLIVIGGLSAAVSAVLIGEARYIAPNRPKTENSKRHNSKPEIDFVKIPTAFSNVRRGLKMPLEIFHLGRWKGSNSKSGRRPKNV